MKTTLPLYLGTLLLIGSLNAHAQSARPAARRPRATATESATSSQSTVYKTNIVTITDSSGNLISKSNNIIATTTQEVHMDSGKSVPAGTSKPKPTTAATDGTGGDKKSSDKDAMSTNAVVNSHISLNSGLILLNPYRLTTNGLTGDTTNRRMLDKSDGTQAKFFIDLAINYVWAWDTDRRERFAEELNGEEGGIFLWQKNNAKFKGAIPLDVQAHISYYAKDSTETTASAIVGSGNFGGELTLGLPIYRALYTKLGDIPQTTGSSKHLSADQCDDLYDSTKSVHWFGLVASYSAVTDSDAFNVHNRYLLGLGYRAAFKTPVKGGDSRYREAVLSLTAAAAGVDTIQFLNSTNREIRMHHGDIPDYAVRPAFALEMEVYFPINSSLSAVLGSRIYTGPDPAVWNSYFGLTVPLDKFADLLK